MGKVSELAEKSGVQREDHSITDASQTLRLEIAHTRGEIAAMEDHLRGESDLRLRELYLDVLRIEREHLEALMASSAQFALYEQH